MIVDLSLSLIEYCKLHHCKIVIRRVIVAIWSGVHSGALAAHLVVLTADSFRICSRSVLPFYEYGRGDGEETRILNYCWVPKAQISSNKLNLYPILHQKRVKNYDIHGRAQHMNKSLVQDTKKCRGQTKEGTSAGTRREDKSEENATTNVLSSTTACPASV